MDETRGDQEADASEHWRQVTAGFVDLGNKLRSYFDSVPDDEATDAMQTAWHDFTDAAQRLGRTVTNAFQDEEVQEGAKNAFNNLIDAVGTSVREAGAGFPWTREAGDEEAEGAEAADEDPHEPTP